MSLTTLSLDLINSIKENYAVLKKINLSNNGLVNIENINQLPSLTAVDLSLNQIVDLRPLLALSSLTYLNLHSNLIGDANVLCGIQSLVQLDLSCNCIYTVEGVRDLSGIPTLRHLNLAQNPLCSHISYPYDVLSRITNLEILDDRPVKEFGQQRAVFEHPTADDNRQERNGLQDQVDALERVLKIQEHTLSTQATREHSGHTQTQFPYEHLLSMWRLKVVELLANKEKIDREYRMRVSELSDKLRTTDEQLQRQSAHAQTWQERCTVAQSQKKLLKLQLVETQETLQQQMEQARRMSNHSGQGEQFVRQMRQGLTIAKRFVDRHGLRAQAILLEILRRIDEFAARLKLANDRLQTLQLLVEQKESHLRNMIAAFEAERRLWHHRRAFESTQHASGQVPSTPEDYGLRVSLKPEVEGILRSVFCAHDEEDRGRVSLKIYHYTLLNDTSITTVLEEAMGETAWQQLKDALNQLYWSKNDERAEITWGEFLLQFIEAEVLPDRHLDREEIATLLHSDAKWSADTWALVPLQLPEHRTSVSAAVEKLKSDDLRKEVSRLANERKYLLSRLQAMSKQNIRVFQTVRSQYDNELHSLRKTLADGKLTQSNLHEQVQRLTARLQEVESASSTTINDLQQRLRESENEKLELYQQHINIKDKAGASGDVDAELRHDRARFERLESEHRILKREANRIEVRCRTLEKENSHLRLIEQQKLDAYTIQQQELATVRKERNNLLARLTELEEQLEARDKQISELQSKQSPPSPSVTTQVLSLAQNPTATDAHACCDGKETERGQSTATRPADKPGDTSTTSSTSITAEPLPRHTSLRAPSSRPQADAIVQRLDRLSYLAERLVQFDNTSNPPNCNTAVEEVRNEFMTATRR